MIAVELAELLSEWWFLLYPRTPAEPINRLRGILGYTVRGGIEAGGQMKCPRTGVGVYE